MKWKDTTYKTRLVCTHYTLMIDDEQMDIFYEHAYHELQIFLEGECILTTTYYPSRASWNFVNLLDVAAKWYGVHKKKRPKL